MFDRNTLDLAKSVVAKLSETRQIIVTAESCTGGLIASALTAIPGSSVVLHGGFVTYSNTAKVDMVGVPPALIAKHGAVSEAVARAMAEGALKKTGADLAISVTGVAGPGGGSNAKPVGLVHFALASTNDTHHLEKQFGDVGRDVVRNLSVLTALKMVLGF